MIFWTYKTAKNVPQALQPIFLALESEKYEFRIPFFELFEKYIKNAPNENCAEWIIHFSKRVHEVPK